MSFLRKAFVLAVVGGGAVYGLNYLQDGSSGNNPNRPEADLGDYTIDLNPPTPRAPIVLPREETPVVPVRPPLVLEEEAAPATPEARRDPVLSNQELDNLNACFNVRRNLMSERVPQDVYGEVILNVGRGLVEQGVVVDRYVADNVCGVSSRGLTAQSAFVLPGQCRDVELKVKVQLQPAEYREFRYEICNVEDSGRRVVAGQGGVRPFVP